MSDTPAPPPGYTLVTPRRRRGTLSLNPPPADPAPPPPPPGYQVIGSPPLVALAPSGAAHDGDTFALRSGGNARLFGVDAFELNQTGRSPAGAVVPLGHMARDRLLPFLPGALALPTGSITYGRPVVTLDNGGDAGSALLHDGLALAEPNYLRADPQRLLEYTQAERLARLNRRGAHGDTYQAPSSFRHGAPDPWNAPQGGVEGNSTAVFWDEPTPFAGLKKDVAAGYQALASDMKSTADDLLTYAKANGFTIDPKEAERFVARRNRGDKSSLEISYSDPPRVLTNPGDGAFGAGVRGFADPVNLLDEAGALADTLLPGAERENLWSSDRRFGDVYANNLEQNRSILDYDDANHPYARFGGQLAGGLVVPGGSVEGVGFAAARKVLQSGGTRLAAEQAARRAVTARLAVAGGTEGAVAGAGAGETWQDRAAGAVIGAPAGAALGGAAGVALPAVVGAARKALGKVRRPDVPGVRAPNDAASPSDAPAGPPGNIANRPIGRFGPIHDDVAGDYHAALGRMAADNAGELPGAIQHPEVGSIDLIWGNDSYGLQHIAKDHPEVVDDLPAIVSGLPVKQYPEEVGNNRFVLDDGTHRAIVAPDFNGETKRWVVTAYEKGGDAPGDQTSRRDPLMPDGGSTGSGAGPDIGSNVPGGNSPAADRARKILADTTEAQRLAQAARIRSGDVLPVPANTVDGVDEAARIASGRVEPVRAPNEIDALSRHSIRSPVDGRKTMPKRGPLDLVTWLRTQGGLKPEWTRGGRVNELEHAGIDNAPRKMDFAGGEGRFGKLVDPENGMNYDDAALAAWEAGYFPDHAERPTIAEFLDAVTATHSGNNRVFHPDDLDEIDAFEAARRQRWEVEAARAKDAPLVSDRGEPVELADLDANRPPVSAYEEWGENAPNLAGNIRLDKLDSPQAIKRALVATDQRVGGFDAATRGRITQAETANLANDLGMTADDLLKRTKGQAFSAEQALAARQILARSATDLVNTARRIARQDNAGDEAEAAFKEAWLRHVAIQEQVAGMTAEAGRALQSFRMVADARAVDRVLPSLGDMMGGSARLKDVADKIVNLEKVGTDPGGINKFAAKALKPRFRDKAIELYYNFLLSGPQTHVVNVLSNTMTALAQIPEHAFAATIGAARKAVSREEVDRVLMSEVGARSVGLLHGVKEGLAQARRTFLTGDASDAVTKVEQATQRAIPGKMGSVIRTPTRALAAEDELFKAMARRMELTGLAVRQAHSEGLSGDAAKARMADLIANPPDDMLAKSFEYGRYLTFQTPLPPHGLTSSISRAAQNNLLIKLVVPFTRTPVNILRYAAERSPVAPLMKSYRADIAAGGARRDLAVARVIAGSGLMALSMQWAAAGHLTGGGPADQSAERLMRADGWQPYSVRIGDRYYSYARLDPLATTLGVAADFAELQSHMTEKQSDQVAMLLATATANNLANKVWFSGAIDLSQAISDPIRYGRSYASRMAASLVTPAVMGQAARTIDPTLREARTLLDAIKARVPGLSSTLLPQRDVWGAPIVREGGVGPDAASPIWTSTAKNDPVNAALLAAGISIGKPQRGDMNDVTFNVYQKLAGMEAHRRLLNVLNSGEWKRLDASGREKVTRKAVSEARKMARELLSIRSSLALPGALAPRSEAIPQLPPGYVLQAPVSAPPAPPPGYVIDQAIPPPPPGYVLQR